MRLAFVLSLFALAALEITAGPIMVGPIPITGSGESSCQANPSDGGEQCSFSVSFSGSAGSDSVSFSAGGSLNSGYLGPYAMDAPLMGFGGTGTTFLVAPGLMGGGSIDGVSSDQALTSSPLIYPVFTVTCCGDGVLDIFDPTSGDLLATAALDGSVITASFTSAPGQFGGVNTFDNFEIVATPEPSSGMLALIGMCIFGLRLIAGCSRQIASYGRGSESVYARSK
jgi:hypothetical protein